MGEFITQPDPEQLMLGGLLAVIIDEELDFEMNELDEFDNEEIIGAVMTALCQRGEDAKHVFEAYGVTEGRESV